MNHQDLIEYDNEQIDQNILVEYGIVKSFEQYQSNLTSLEKAMHGEEMPRVLKLLHILDKEDIKALRVIHTYLALKLNSDL